MSVKLVISYDKEWSDWVVKWYENGRLNEEKSYHAYEDKADAVETMHQMYIEGLDLGLDIQEDPLYLDRE